MNPFIEKGYGYREIIFYPSFFDEQYFEIDQLQNMAIKGSVNYTGWPFIYYNQNDSNQSYIVDDGIETFISEKQSILGSDLLHYWHLSKTGLFYTKEILWEDSYLRSQGSTASILDFELLCKLAAKTYGLLDKNLH